MRKSILIINENIDEAAKIKERLVSAYNDVECVDVSKGIKLIGIFVFHIPYSA